jgi:hypothetical protein
MKQIYLYLACLLFTIAAHAERHPSGVAPGNTTAKGGVKFMFNNFSSGGMHKDSVLIIFDRYNHTGAGVIYQVFTADTNRCITIQDVPAGKYYVTIKGLGLHRDQMEMIVRIKSSKKGKVKINLEDSEEFSKDNVVIPVFHPSFDDMAVLRTNK